LLGHYFAKLLTTIDYLDEKLSLTPMRFSGMRVAIPPVELFQRGFAVEKRASWFGFMKLNRKIGFAALAYLGSLPRPGRKWFKGLFAPLNQIKASYELRDAYS
jgi:hypothetical protein